MFDRGTLKANGKAAFTKNYWKCVLAGFLLSIAEGSARSGSSSGRSSSSSNSDGLANAIASGNLGNEIDSYMAIIAGILAVVLVIVVIAAIIGIALKIFVLNPLAVGTNKFFVQNAINPETSLSVMGDGFKIGYKNNAKVMFQKDLYIFLWSLLFIIPGIIKGYEYMMIPYLLADNPEMTADEAFRRSKEIMDGHKMDAFILGLSFIGWRILGIFTCGLLDLFFTSPYYFATRAEMYLTLNPSYSANVDNGADYYTTY